MPQLKKEWALLGFVVKKSLEWSLKLAHCSESVCRVCCIVLNLPALAEEEGEKEQKRLCAWISWRAKLTYDSICPNAVAHCFLQLTCCVSKLQFLVLSLSLSFSLTVSVCLSECVSRSHSLSLSCCAFVKTIETHSDSAAVVCVSGRMLLLLMLHMVVYRRTLSTGGSDLELERGKVRERKRGARYARDGNQSRRPAHDDDDDEKIIRFDSVYWRWSKVRNVSVRLRRRPPSSTHTAGCTFSACETAACAHLNYKEGSPISRGSAGQRQRS